MKVLLNKYFRNIVSIGQLKKFELTLYGTNDVHEDTIDFAQPPATTAKDADKWPGVKTAQKLPQPRFSYISTHIHSKIDAW